MIIIIIIPQARSQGLAPNSHSLLRGEKISFLKLPHPDSNFPDKPSTPLTPLTPVSSSQAPVFPPHKPNTSVNSNTSAPPHMSAPAHTDAPPPAKDTRVFHNVFVVRPSDSKNLPQVHRRDSKSEIRSEPVSPEKPSSPVSLSAPLVTRKGMDRMDSLFHVSFITPVSVWLA